MGEQGQDQQHGARPVSLDITRAQHAAPRSAVTPAAGPVPRKPAQPAPLAADIELPTGQQFGVIGTAGGTGATTVALALAGLLARDRDRVLFTETSSSALPRTTPHLGVSGKGTQAAAWRARMRGENPANVCERSEAGIHTLVGSRRGEFAPPDQLIAENLQALLPGWAAAVVDAGTGPRLAADHAGRTVPNFVASMPVATQPSTVWIVVTGNRRQDLETAAATLEVLESAHVDLRRQVGLVTNHAYDKPDRRGRAARTALSGRAGATVTLRRTQGLAENPTHTSGLDAATITGLTALVSLGIKSGSTKKSEGNTNA